MLLIIIEKNLIIKVNQSPVYGFVLEKRISFLEKNQVNFERFEEIIEVYIEFPIGLVPISRKLIENYSDIQI